MIKILRMKTGEDVISFIEETPTEIILSHPLSIFIKFDEKINTQKLYLSYWLPVNLILENKVTIPKSEILFILNPKKEFEDYYFNYLNDFKSVEELSTTVKENYTSIHKFH